MQLAGALELELAGELGGDLRDRRALLALVEGDQVVGGGRGGELDIVVVRGRLPASAISSSPIT